jgi:hypothetical protein
MTCFKCKKIIPEGRVNLGYKTCIKCSQCEPYGYVPVTNHKTGNTIQIVPVSQARSIRKSGERKGYGTCLKR